MAAALEIAVNVANVAIGVLIFGLVALLANAVRTLGRDVVMAALYLRERDSARGVVLLFSGLVAFLLSNVLELYGDIQSIDWTLNELVETAALFLILAGIVRFVLLLRGPSSHRGVA